MTKKEKGQTEWSQETLLGMGRAFMESRVLLTGCGARPVHVGGGQAALG